MIKRSANKQGLVTFNISFQNLKPNSNFSKGDPGNASSPFNEQTQASFLSNRSNPLTPLDFDDQHKVLRHESRSISSDVDWFDAEETQPSEGPTTKPFHHFNGNDENISRAVTEEFQTQEPIDFEDLQRNTGIYRDDEDKSSASTLSKSSKKIAKAKAGFVYKESRFKEEARNKGKRQAWQPHEDEKVLELVAKHGQSWALIASMMEGRSGKQIRDRYLNKLKPDINNQEWTKEEDNLLISLFHTIGRKWSKIATNMPGRTEGQVKNRFYSHIQKRVLPKENSDYASASPEGEMSPASKVNEIINRKPASERKFFGESAHSNSGYKSNKDKLRVQVSRNNAASNLNKSLGFQEEINLYNNSNLQYPKSGFQPNVSDPTDVISYNEISNSNVKRMSPEKYQSRNAFYYGEVKEGGLPQNNQSFFNRETRSDCLLGPEQDSTGFVELAQEFKVRCNTGNYAKENVCQNRETNYIERSPLFQNQSIDQFLNKEIYVDNKFENNQRQMFDNNASRRGNMYDYRNMALQGMYPANSLNSYRYPNQNQDQNQNQNQNMF